MPLSLIAFLRALASLFHPKMLAVLILPILVSAIVWFAVAFFAWEPVSSWVTLKMIDQGTWMGRASKWAASWGIGGVKEVLMATIAILFFVPLAFVTALVFTAALAMPVVVRFLEARGYGQVQRLGRFAIGVSLRNSLLSVAIFLIGYFISIPLWFVPALGLLVPWLWWSWLTQRMLRVDSLLEHATDDERRHLLATHRGQYFFLGLLVTALNYIPFMVLVTPVLSALAFGHFSLAALRDLRASGYTIPIRLS